MSGTTIITPAVQDVLHPGYVSGRWYGLAATVALVGAAATAGVIYFCPIPVARRVRVSALGIVTQAAVPGVSGKMALYANDPERGLPGALIAECVGVADMNATAITTIPLSFAAPRVLEPGWYWGASLFDGAALPYSFGALSAISQGIPAAIGGNSMRNLVTSGNAAASAGVSVVQPYAAGFPQLPAAEHTVNNPGSPYIGFLAA